MIIFYNILCLQFTFSGAERLIRQLHKTKVPFALATSSSERSVQTKEAAYKELFSFFHHKVMGSTDKEVKFGKPHPDIFLVAASRFPDKPDPSKVWNVPLPVLVNIGKKSELYSQKSE